VSRRVEFWHGAGALLGITSVAALLAPLLGAKETTVRQRLRLREWCYDAADKSGNLCVRE